VAQAPQLLPLFETMAGEAAFGREWLAGDIARLPAGAAILEVGGGIFLLSCQLAREGFAVTAIEPVGEGFGEFQQLGAIILDLARAEGKTPTIAPCMAEEFTSDIRFDLAFSVNVMEHIDRPDIAIRHVTAALKPGASYRFLCPNYLFPYEPHFGIPIFGSKRLTEKLCHAKIYHHAMPDAAGVWKSLNWITVPQVRRFVAADEDVVLSFRRDTLRWILERALKDTAFAARRAGWMLTLIRVVVALRLHRLADLVPAVMQPIMDVRLTRRL
jgi:2-polyprenyl-3-methyl-5-hydroxy-6-metoxy-1,4-benzoquinol methylase